MHPQRNSSERQRAAESGRAPEERASGRVRDYSGVLRFVKSATKDPLVNHYYKDKPAHTAIKETFERLHEGLFFLVGKERCPERIPYPGGLPGCPFLA